MKLSKSLPFILLINIGVAKAQTGDSMLLNKDLVDLKGKEATTVFINSTPDTLNLSYKFFNWLPYTETVDKLIIPPGQKDSITLTYNFPDFVYVNQWFKVYNGPGSKLICNILDYKPGDMKLAFKGRFAAQNDYYLAYHKFLGNYGKESDAYYIAAERLTDWNQFPAIASSITKGNQAFLEQYKGDLPDWFKKHEYRRLLYNEYCRLSNALNAKKYHTGKDIKVDASYFDFEKLIGKDDDMVLSDTYFYCMDNYFNDQRATGKKDGLMNVPTIDSLYHQTDIGDVNLMFALGRLFKYDRKSYQQLLTGIKFKDEQRKIWLDSLIKTKLEKPQSRTSTASIFFKDINGKKVSLADYKGKVLIVNFWAVWCSPCKVEFPHENKLYQQYKATDLVVVNICFESDKAMWEADTKKHNLQMINLFSDKTDLVELRKRFDLSSLPASILINRDGKIADKYLQRASKLSDDDIAGLLKL